ncbi:MAG: hypothetical protein IT539_02065 [Bradyrhizobiaceae bacterium]|nr:hypothetical protein [Bradyrhizobiaceae bacterium]
MKKALVALAAGAAFLAATMAVPNPADASSSGRRLTQGILLGIAGAALFGAAARAAIDPRYHAYAPVEGYYYYPTYAAAPLAPCPGGFWAARPTAFDAFGRPVRWSKPRWVCPPQGYGYTHYYYR